MATTTDLNPGQAALFVAMASGNDDAIVAAWKALDAGDRNPTLTGMVVPVLERWVCQQALDAARSVALPVRGIGRIPDDKRTPGGPTHKGLGYYLSTDETDAARVALTITL